LFGLEKFPRFLGADLNFSSKFVPMTKKVGRFFQNMFGLAPSGLATYIQGSFLRP
jgi:hypothetical protein